MNAPIFSFIVVTYNNAETIQACLDSVAAYTSSPFEVIVIDNSPDHETANAIQTAVQFIKPDRNVGFGRACNLGSQEASGEFLFFLNPDTQLKNNAAELLRTCFEKHRHAAAAGPALLDSQGRVARTCRNLPNLRRIFLDAIGADKWLGAYRLTRFGHNSARMVEQIIGAAMLVRRTDYERVGGMDERFFMYFEEVDFCKRVSENGGEIWFWPEARVQHGGGGSSDSGSVRARMIYILRESRRKYFQKHFGTISAWLLGLINRLEGFQKSIVLWARWLFRRERVDREKAYGFWAVATGVEPRS